MTIAFYLVPERTNNLYLRISHGKQRSTHSAGVSIESNDWDPQTNLPKPTSRYASAAGLLIDRLEDRARELAYTGADVVESLKADANEFLRMNLDGFTAYYFDTYAPAAKRASFAEHVEAGRQVFADKDFQTDDIVQAGLIIKIQDTGQRWLVTSHDHYKAFITERITETDAVAEEIGFFLYPAGIRQAYQKSGITGLDFIADEYTDLQQTAFDIDDKALSFKEFKRYRRDENSYLQLLATLLQTYPLIDVVERIDRDSSVGRLAEAITKRVGKTQFVEDYLMGVNLDEKTHQVAVGEETEKEFFLLPVSALW